VKIMWPFGKRKRLLKKPGLSKKSAQSALGLTRAAKKGQGKRSSRQETDAAAKALEQMESQKAAQPAKPRAVPKQQPAKQKLASVLKRIKPGKSPLSETLKTNPAFRQSLAGALGKAGFKNPEALIEKIAGKLEAGQSLEQIIQELEKG
jgi:hypothetical protein